LKLIFKITEDWEDETLDFWLNKEFRFWYFCADKRYYPLNVPTTLINTLRRLNK